MNAILSIKPVYADQILAGTKKVEFRKAAFKKQVDRVYIYSSAPKMRIVGYFTIKEIVCGTPRELWEMFASVGGINQADFFDYYKTSELGVSFLIDRVTRFEVGIVPVDVIADFVPPQSYRYLASHLPELKPVFA